MLAVFLFVNFRFTVALFFVLGFVSRIERYRRSVGETIESGTLGLVADKAVGKITESISM
jgi:hypothetical protein